MNFFISDVERAKVILKDYFASRGANTGSTHRISATKCSQILDVNTSEALPRGTFIRRVKTLDPVIGFEIVAFIVSLTLILVFPLTFVFQITASKILFFSFGSACLSYLLLILLSQSKNLLKDIRKFHSGEIGKPQSYKYFWYPILVSVPEELLFRLVLPSVVFLIIPSWPWSVLVSSTTFGIVHIRKGVTFLVPLTAFLIGIIFAVTYELSHNNLLAPIFAHFVFTILRVYKFAKGDEE